MGLIGTYPEIAGKKEGGDRDGTMEKRWASGRGWRKRTEKRTEAREGGCRELRD
jgi:hypothetical protein